MRLPWRRVYGRAQTPTPLVRGCAALRGHAGHVWQAAGRTFSCPGIEPRGVLPRHPSDHVIGEPAYDVD